MTTFCIVLLMTHGGMLPIHVAWPDEKTCHEAGKPMVDGKIVRGYICSPRSVFAGIPKYDCAPEGNSGRD